ANITHVIAETSDLDVEAFVVRNCNIHPVSDLLLHLWTLPVSDDDLVLLVQTSIDEAVLTVAVRRLVQVHEVHVDRRPWDALVVLSSQVKQRLLQQLRATDPHLRWRERMHPSDDTGYLV